jgi:hypothetical protein
MVPKMAESIVEIMPTAALSVFTGKCSDQSLAQNKRRFLRACGW